MSGTLEKQKLEYVQNAIVRIGIKKKHQNECPTCDGWKDKCSKQCQTCRNKIYNAKRICQQCGGEKGLRGNICDSCHRKNFKEKYNTSEWYKIRKHVLSQDGRERMSTTKIAENNPNWKGSEASPEGGRYRARSLYPLKPCERCGKINNKINRHHKDGNTLNNDISNISFLCGRCHMIVDGRMEKLMEMNHKKIKDRSTK